MNTIININHPDASWLITHNKKSSDGPLSLETEGQLLLENFHNSCDALSSADLPARKVRNFRKSGSAIFNSEVNFPLENKVHLQQNIRYSGNMARIVYDLNWRKGATIKQDFQLGSAVLCGKWQSLTVIYADENMTVESKNLEAGNKIIIDKLPLSMIFTNENSLSIELGTGDDLWRWQKALENSEASKRQIIIEVLEDKLLFSRKLFVNNTEEAYLPNAREYRFSAYLAWSCPKLQTLNNAPTDTNFIAVATNEPKGLNRKELAACGNDPAISIDLSALPLPDQAKRNCSEGFCWQSRITQKAARLIIRQLADYSSKGKLLISGGLNPGICNNPSHCNQKNEALHWDMMAIVDFCSWTQQKLGQDWKIYTRNISEKWENNQAVKCLATVNGFGI